MKKTWKFSILLICILGVSWTAKLVAEHSRLGEELVRLHVVAASDSAEDQRVKLQVRDAVMEWIQREMPDISDATEVKAWLGNHLNDIQKVANATLQQENQSVCAAVSLQKEAFPVRDYDTFSLPSGVYDALRITIGQGRGKNWWCVVFPSLCMAATTEDFDDTAAGAGFSDTLSNTLSQKRGYEVRFFFLDWIGKVENFFFGR